MMSKSAAPDLLVWEIVDTELGFETIDGCCLPSISDMLLSSHRPNVVPS